MIPLFKQPWFTFRFAEDRLIPRFHLEGPEPGCQVAVHAADPDTLRPLRLLATAVVGEGGWVDLAEPIVVRAGEAFVVIPEKERSMPRQNRVTPTGELVATTERGMFMGNRGVLHDDKGCIKRAWDGNRWIICSLEFKGRKRKLMTPGHYTELFFLDEATGLAAGHRPCAECRRGRFDAFRKAWMAGNLGIKGSQMPGAVEIDAQLHVERVAPDRSPTSFLAKLDDLPTGVFVTQLDRGASAYLIWNDWLLAWTPGGYKERLPRQKGTEVLVLTPRSTVAAITAGFVPEIHSSAEE